MFKATGAGKIEAHREFVQAGVITALLYNFDFDDFADHKFRPLKEEHKNFLREEVLPLLSGKKANIWMQGSASRIGTDSWNMTLSQVRVGSVLQFLADNGATLEQIQSNAIGEQDAKLHAPDDERDRGVFLWVYPRFEYEPPPPRKVPKRPLVTRHFKISMVTGLNVAQALRIAKLFKVKIGAGLAIDGLVFLIWDPYNQIACYYVYIGIGLGFGFSALPSVALTTHGPWTDFTTEKPMSCWQFGRWARFTSGGGGSHTVNWITFETPRGINNVESLPIATGTTYGVGATSTIGDLIRATDPYRFSGP